MPELPEVETTRRGIEPHVRGQRISQVIVRDRRLRWPVPQELAVTLCGQTVTGVERRGKYLLFGTAAGTLLLHLGMSGSLRVLPEPQAPRRHEHVDIVFAHGPCLRYTDPRRFGSLHWVADDPRLHPLLAHLGPEPLSDAFSGGYLYRRSRGRRSAIKAFLMDSEIVVGVGNIYANEALHQAGIRPARAAGQVGLARYVELAQAVKRVLGAAIKAGGTTLRDFTGSEGKPGYFKQELRVYGRAGEACPNCETAIELLRLGQRATYFCPRCQR
jgi:formamidopyrimidine-DNA glycosylase